MNKVKISTFSICAIFLVAFNACFFLLGGFDHPASVWIAYGVIHASFAMLLLTPLFTKSDKRHVENAMPLFALSAAHFVLEFIIGIIVFIISPDGYKGLLVLFIILIAAYLIAFLSLWSANAQTNEAMETRAKEIFYIKDQASRLKMLLERTSDKELSKRLEAVYDNLHAAPTKSSPAVSAIEASIVAKIDDIEASLRDARNEDVPKLLEDLQYLIDDRSRILKNSY